MILKESTSTKGELKMQLKSENYQKEFFHQLNVFCLDIEMVSSLPMILIRISIFENFEIFTFLVKLMYMININVVKTIS